MKKSINYSVKNINGTSSKRYQELNCNCKSWIAHYKNNTGSLRTTCCVIGCTRKVEVGAHVHIIDKSMGRSWYVLPFCKKCNQSQNTGSMLVDSRVKFVSVFKQDGCA